MTDNEKVLKKLAARRAANEAALRTITLDLLLLRITSGNPVGGSIGALLQSHLPSEFQTIDGSGVNTAELRATILSAP
jgi:hypothetical protein